MDQVPERKDVANISGDVYFRTAQLLLGPMHSFLFGEIEKYLSSIEAEKTLLIIGHGDAVLPFSYDPKRVSNMLGPKGKIVLVDYSVKKIENAIAYLTKIDFFKKSNLTNNGLKEISDPKSLEARTMTFTEGNIKRQLNFENGVFDCIDMTLTGHHATPFLADLDKLTSELYRVMKRGAIIHYGEGSRYMNSESKIIKLAEYAVTFFDTNIIFTDMRDKEFVKRGLFEKGVAYARFPEKQEIEREGLELILDELGQVTLITPSKELAVKFCKFLGLKGRKEIRQFEDIVYVPLIDEGNKDDKTEFIDPIWTLYGSLINKVTKHFAKDPKFRIEARKAITDEFENAKRGLVEYYKSIGYISNSMLRSGFKELRKKMYRKSLFGSLIARKG